jgi:hypothetical protein
MIRPQFPFPTPPDCYDEDFVYSFNSTNTPALGTSIAAGAQLQNIPLLLTPDAPFLWRGLSTPVSNLMIRFKEPAGNYLSDGYVPIDLYTVPAGITTTQGTPVILEADAGDGQGAIFCPAGGIVTVYFYNSTAGSLTPPSIQLLGVKRYPKSLRKACA